MHSHPADRFVVEPPPEIAALSLDEAVERARGLAWYHTMDLGAFVTSGQFNIAPVLDAYGFPEDMTGMTVLDVGRSTGYFAFEFERRGATVYATELPPTAFKDMAGGVAAARRYAEAADHAWRSDRATGVRAPFYLAHRILGSRVRLLYAHIQDLSAETLGRFDLVFAGSLLNHVRDIAGGVERLYDVTGDRCITATPVSADTSGKPTVEYVGRGSTWWIPSAAAMKAICETAGFVAEVHAPSVALPFLDRDLAHVIIHARRGAEGEARVTEGLRNSLDTHKLPLS